MIMVNRKHLVRISAVVMAGIAAVLGCSCARTQNARAEDGKPSDITTVAVAKASVEDMSHSIVLTAEFKPYQEVEVMAKVSGYVKPIKVDVGDRVQEGQLLAVLEVPEMADDEARAQSVLSRSQAELARGRDELQRAESAHKVAHDYYTRLSQVAKQQAGLLSQQEVDDAQSKDLVAEAQVSAAKSNVSAAEQQVQVSTAEIQKVKTLFDYTRVTAPFAGVVTKRYADTGSMIQAGTSSSTQAMPLIRLSENSRLRLILPVPESAVPTVHIGQQVDVRVPSLGRSFPGVVARFAEKVMSATRTMDTEVDVMNPSLVLIPGMYAEADLTLDHRKGVLTIPIPSVDLASDGKSGQVAVVTSENRIEIRKVQLGLQTETKVEVLSGLRDGDMVVTSNRSSLKSGQEVRPKPATAAAGAS
jgi:RND family efflux transporter MFP subunit